MEKRTEILARACHAAWYAYTVLALREEGEHWDKAPDFQKDSIRNAVEFWDKAMIGHETEDWVASIVRLSPLSHKNWMEHKRSEGWVYGPEKDAERKTHHCMVAYGDLPEAQRVKDAVVIQAYLSLREVV